MSKRAKLSLSPRARGAPKSEPAFDEEPPVGEPAAAAPRAARAGAWSGRRIATVAVVVVVGALSIYLLRRYVGRAGGRILQR